MTERFMVGDEVDVLRAVRLPDTGFVLATAPDVVGPQKVRRCECRATNPKFAGLPSAVVPPADSAESKRLTDRVRRGDLERIGR